ncbi:transcriptional regulator [Actinomadura craniellae]|uniref:Transcriptional regulator n=1 Tax=Actinomadura craniellae TaxID=2231787 RepID=A0A365HDM6_9ACTN|nr:helix-turn-helix transcriptional regulator [Actinomadura craniellae]RAY17187.1 transcriptional regulator [Actinomadura craniellae]
MNTAPAAEGSPVSPLQGHSRSGPTVRRIVLGAQLRRLRERRGLSTEEAGDAIRASHSKISRIELGRVGFKQRDITDLLTLYGVTDSEERAMTLQLAVEANRPGWWHRYSDVLPRWFEVYIGLEEAASLMRAYEVQFVPGLMQTREYARAVIRHGHAEATQEEMDRRLSVRMARQLRVGEALSLWAVVDEAALRRPMGGPEVMRDQIQHLLNMTEQPNVTLQVVPFASGGHAAAGGPFTILRFAEPALPDVVYLEQLNSALYLDKPHDTDGYMRVMDRLCIQAAQPAETKRILFDLLKSY